MSENMENSYMCMFPSEILLYFFKYLPAKDLTRCREVCMRWKLIIDELTRNDDLWYRYCKEDYASIYISARMKAEPTIPWYNLYRSLELWKKIGTAKEEMDEFSSASSLVEEILNFEVLSNGTIGVHKKGSIVYYDHHTFELSKKSSIIGNYSRYTENCTVIVILSMQLHLFLIRKVIPNDCYGNTTFDNVKLFTLLDKELYFVNLNDEIYKCCFNNNKKLAATFIKKSDDGIMSMGYSNGLLNILTFERDIYSVIDNKLVFMCSLGPDSNLLHQLHHYNFLQQLDWRVYFQWMYVLNHSIPNGPLRDIITIKPYGDVYFVGSNFGVLRIYYAPYSRGEFDIFNSQPIKQYNFMERSDCPVLSTCPILQVDVLEDEDKHTVIVAMPKKIAILKLTHSFEPRTTQAILPYTIKMERFLYGY